MQTKIAHLAVASIAALIALATYARSLGGPWRLADEGTFFVGGRQSRRLTPEPHRRARSPWSDRRRSDVRPLLRIPENSEGKLPVVLVHGGGLTEDSYEATPDNREGWATYFARQGYPVYAFVARAGAGRSGSIQRASTRRKRPANRKRFLRTC